MRNLWAYILRHQLILLFVLFEIISFILIFQFNPFQQSVFYNFTLQVSARINSKVSHVREYLHLKEINEDLAYENLYLKNRISELTSTNEQILLQQLDTSFYPRYSLQLAKVVNNSIDKRNNYLTLNIGTDEGVKPEMGVISSSGIVGMINRVSKNYCTAFSILNTKFSISAKLKNTDYFGPLSWSGIDYKSLVLKEIPHHAIIHKGDTVVTSGLSPVFPEGILIGLVKDFDLIDGNFYEVRVELATALKSLTYVYVIENMGKIEQQSIEKLNKNDKDSK